MTPEVRKVAALYARVSTLDQNCEVQLHDLRRYAGQRLTLYREYIDVGVSGAQRHRPQGVDTTTPSGQLLFHIVGAVAQFERDLIAERVRAGMAHARAMGKHIGRPRALVDIEAVQRLRSTGKSLRTIATTLGIPVSRVRRALVHRDGMRKGQ